MPLQRRLATLSKAPLYFLLFPIRSVMLHALNVEDKMLKAVLSGALTAHDAMNALNIAAAANKFSVHPVY